MGGEGLTWGVHGRGKTPLPWEIASWQRPGLGTSPPAPEVPVPYSVDVMASISLQRTQILGSLRSRAPPTTSGLLSTPGSLAYQLQSLTGHRVPHCCGMSVVTPCPPASETEGTIPQERKTRTQRLGRSHTVSKGKRRREF